MPSDTKDAPRPRDGLFARRQFAANQDILDYAYMNGVNGERVDHLTAAERWLRYPALPGNPDGTGKYLLQVGNGGLYLDALKTDSGSMGGGEMPRGIKGMGVRCGLGGKANTNPGHQNARFKGSKIRAVRVIRSGDEIFVPYRKCYKFTTHDRGEERFGWGVIGRRFYRDMG